MRNVFIVYVCVHVGHIKGGKLLIVMMGLPGRGKTYIARKVARYLRWISYRTRGKFETYLSHTHLNLFRPKNLYCPKVFCRLR